MREIGIPCIYGLDQNHGTTYTMGGTLFPQNINVAASFNRNLAREAARITAYETKAGSCPWTYSPTIDLGRDPRWPRIWENYGEDCYVNAEMGRAAVLGFQGEDPNHIGKQNIAVSLKHYMGYSVPFTGKDRTPVYISAQDLREKHFAPFLACVKAGALSVMANSCSVNGLPVHANYKILTQWLKEELNWDGVLVTDWADINNLWRREKVAADKKEAIKIAINAGIDMAMEPYEWDFCTLLKELVHEGEVPISRINDATRRVLRMKFRLGLFDTPTYDTKDFPLFGRKEHATTALHAAEETMVLLKNTDNILPLAKGKRLLVTGPNANSMRCLNGGWSYTWQGHLTNHFTDEYNTILEALANLLSGDENFSGKLPFTYPKEINSLINYNYKVSEEVEKMEGAYDYDAVVSVQWAFGYGLSYTSFSYSNLKVNKANFTADDELIFTVDVKNTGSRAGKESVLLFNSALIASMTSDSRRLRAPNR